MALQHRLQQQKQQRAMTENKHAKYLFIVFLFGLILLVCSYASKVDDLSVGLFNIPDVDPTKDYRWSYECLDNKCVRKRTSNDIIVSLTTCEMLCDPPLWPKPSISFVYEKTHHSFLKEQINFTYNASVEVSSLLDEACGVFMANLDKLDRPVQIWRQKSDVKSINVKLSVMSDVIKLKLSTDESYQTQIIAKDEVVFVNILGETYFGVRHALETLSQLIWWDEFESDGMLKMLSAVTIEDAPKFPYRGLMIDTARNFFPLGDLKRAVIGMSANKLNVLHLHLTDSESFPIVLSRAKPLSVYGAYAPNMVYTEKDIEELKKFALARGVRLVLEIDAPSHLNSGWDFPNNNMGDLVICNKETHNNGHLNPDNPNSLDILGDIYSSLLNVSGDTEIFHMGNDEVNLSCWQNTNAAQNYTNMFTFWTDYTNGMLDRLKSANNGRLPENVVMWSSPLTNSEYLTQIDNYKNVIVQHWFGKPLTFLYKNLRVIFSTVGHWYLDCGFGSWRPSQFQGSCDPYTPWQKFYAYRPWKEYSAEHLTVGGEVCLWSEQVERASLDTRLWPRSAAFAERIWSDPSFVNIKEVAARLVKQRERLIGRGLSAAAIWPRWCSQNPGKC